MRSTSQGNARAVSGSYGRFGGNAAQRYFFLCHGIGEGLSLAVSYLWFIWQCIWTERQLCQTLCFISVKRDYKVRWVLEESVSLALHSPGCDSALHPAAMSLVSAFDLDRFDLAWHQLHKWLDLPLPFSIPLLSTETHHPAVPRAWGHGVLHWLCPRAAAVAADADAVSG